MAAIGLCTLRGKKKKPSEMKETEDISGGHYACGRDFMDESCFSLLSIPGLVEIEIRLEKQTMSASYRKEKSIPYNGHTATRPTFNTCYMRAEEEEETCFAPKYEMNEAAHCSHAFVCLQLLEHMDKYLIS